MAIGKFPDKSLSQKYNNAYKINFHIIPIFTKLQDKGITSSFLTYLCNLLKLKKFLDGFQFDVCWTGTLIAASLSKLLKKWKICKKVVYDDPDFFPDSYSGLLKPYISLLENNAIKNSDLIISCSDILYRLREKQGITNLKMIPHGIDFSLFEAAYKKRLKRISQENFSPKKIIFMGNSTEELRSESFLRFLVHLFNYYKEAKLIIVGICDLKVLNNFFKACEKANIENNITYLGLVPYGSIPDILSSSDIALSKIFSPTIKYGITRKIPQYLALGLPILASSNSPASKLLTQNNVGKVANLNTNSLVHNMISLLSLSNDEYVQMSKRAHKIGKKHDWNVLKEKYIANLKSA